MADPRHREGAQRAGERAAKNTLVRAVGEIVGKLASLVLFAALGRKLGESDLGVFVLALAFLQIASTPVELGFSRYIVRQVARDRSSADELFFNVVALKLALSVPVVGGSLVGINLLGYDGRTRETVYVLTAGILLDSFTKTIFSLFTAHERGELQAITLIVQRVAAAALGLAALAAGLGVVSIAATYTAGAALGLIQAAVLTRRHIGVPRWLVDRPGWRRLALVSLPFAIQDVFTALLFRLDAVILSLIGTEAEVGRYGAAYRLLDSTLFLTYAISGAFIAMYAYLDTDSDPSIQSVFGRSIKLALVALVPCAAVLAVLAEPISRLFFGAELEDASGALRLLAPVAVLIGLVTLASALVASRRSPVAMGWITGGMVVLNVVLNVVLIPPYHEEGAAAAMLVTEVVFAGVAMVFAARAVGGQVHWTATLTSPLVAGVAMGVPLVLLRDSLPLATIAGVAVYASVFVLVERRVSPGDLRFARELVARRLRPLAPGRAAP